MSEPVQWRADGTPFSTRFQDVYRSAGLDGLGGLVQAREVFLAGCDLPQAWANHAQWRILETGFGLGLNFLATWQAWKADPRRPRLLHYAAIEAFPASADDLLRSAAPFAELEPLARELSRQYWGLMPGFHRFAFEEGRVLLTLCIGDIRAMLRELDFHADSVFLDGFSPRRNPQMWEPSTLKGVARLCRRGARAATWSVAGELREGLAQCGFAVQKVDGVPPKRHRLRAVFDPAWEPRRAKGRLSPQSPSIAPASCLVVGAGLAGAAVAASLVRRGWQVHVLDARPQPAQGASGLPAGVLAPHASADDNAFSRIVRAGLRITLEQASRLLEEGVDWQPGGALEHRTDGSHGLPLNWPDAGSAWSRPADEPLLAACGLPRTATALWHPRGGWIRPAALVNRWLAHPSIHWHGHSAVLRLVRDGDAWSALDAQGRLIGQAACAVVAAGPASAALLARSTGEAPAPLLPIRGQVSWGTWEGDSTELPSHVVKGHGSFIPAARGGSGTIWLAGASFQRGDDDTSLRQADQAANLERLHTLLPRTAAALRPQFEAGKPQAWAGVRCASPDRLPMVGPVAGHEQPWVSTALGSRGLTFAALCAELLAARMHGEPLPLPARLAKALDAGRF